MDVGQLTQSKCSAVYPGLVTGYVACAGVGRLRAHLSRRSAVYLRACTVKRL
jgi:hypothetical protein